LIVCGSIMSFDGKAQAYAPEILEFYDKSEIVAETVVPQLPLIAALPHR